MKLVRYILVFLSLLSFAVLASSCNDAEKRKQQEFHDESFTKKQEEFVNSLSEYSTKDMELYEKPYMPDLSWLERLFGKDSPLIYIFKAIGVILIIVAVGFLIKWFAGLQLKSNDKTVVKKKADLNTIYNHDFTSEIQESINSKNWTEAVKLIYLQTLHHFDSSKQIKWNESKTPMEYYYEYKAARLRPTFYRLTSLFLTARYANIETTEEMCATAQECNKILTTTQSNRKR